MYNAVWLRLAVCKRWSAADSARSRRSHADRLRYSPILLVAGHLARCVYPLQVKDR